MGRPKKLYKPEAFGMPAYPSFDFHVSHGTVQVYPLRSNACLYEKDFKKFGRWLERVKAYGEREIKKYRL